MYFYWSHLLYVIRAISAISDPVGPQESLLVAVQVSNLYRSSVKPDVGIPFRTLTCTVLYPFVTFLTLRMTADIVATLPKCSQVFTR